MPWSEWVQSANQIKRPDIRRHLDYGTGDSFSTATDLLNEYSDIVGAQAGTSPAYQGHQATQYHVQSDWDEVDFLPDEFAFLTYGVDYTIKPGADPSDPFRYVDYDPDDHAEVIGWTIPSPVVYDRMGDFNLGANVWIDPVTDYGLGTTDPLVIGATFDTIDPTTPAGTVLAAPPDPGNTLAVTVGISPTTLVGDSGAVNIIATGPAYTGWPTITVRPQRWRYWRPGILPLRQYPRNDGLKGSAPSARPTSRQGTTARRTYL